MSELFWRPQEELIQQSWAFAQQSRIGRFLGFSTVLHFVFAALSPWLLLSFSMTSHEERLVIRTVDFVLPAEAAPVSEKRETKGGGGGGPVTPEKIARPARRPPASANRGPREVAAPSTPTRERAPAQVKRGELPVAARSTSEAEDVNALAESLTQADDPPARWSQLPPETKRSDRPGPREIVRTPTPARDRGPAHVERAGVPVVARSSSEAEDVKSLVESLTRGGDLPTRSAPLTPTIDVPARSGPREIPARPTPGRETGPVQVEPSERSAPARSGSEVGAVKTLAESLSEAGDLPTLPPHVPSTAIPAAAGPKAVGGSTTSRASRRTGPAAVAKPPSQVAGSGRRGGGAGGHGASQVVALARELSGLGGPIATVAIPRELVQDGAGRGGVGSGGGAGAGVGRGVGVGGGASTGPGAGLVNTRDPDFSEYFQTVKKRVRAAWQFPESLGGTTQTVKLGFSLRLDGSLQDVRVVSSTSGTLNVSALTAMKRASPFPPLPVKFHALGGQPLVMSFTVTIK